MTGLDPPAGLRLAVDAHPLLGQRSGVGRYVEGLLCGLAELADAPAPVLALFNLWEQVPEPLPPGSRPARRTGPAALVPRRVMNRLWRRVPGGGIELLTGPIEVFHAGNYVLPPLRRAAGVVTVHDLAYLRYPETVDDHVATYRTRVPDALRRSARAITVSSAVRDELVAEYSLDPARVLVAPNGVDPAWASAVPLTAAARTRLRVPERYLLFVGNLEPRKGLPVLVRAHAAARREDPGVPPLLLVGPPGWGDAWAGAEPDRADARHLGFVPDEDLRSLVAGATAVCTPSRYEGFGLPVLEALACGRPVLASDLPAHREVGGDAVTFLPPDDIDGWAGAIVDVSSHDDPVQAAGARRDRARPFTWQRSAEVHLQAWRAAAAERPTGAR